MGSGLDAIKKILNIVGKEETKDICETEGKSAGSVKKVAQKDTKADESKKYNSSKPQSSNPEENSLVATEFKDKQTKNKTTETSETSRSEKIPNKSIDIKGNKTKDSSGAKNKNKSTTKKGAEDILKENKEVIKTIKEISSAAQTILDYKNGVENISAEDYKKATNTILKAKSTVGSIKNNNPDNEGINELVAAYDAFMAEVNTFLLSVVIDSEAQTKLSELNEITASETAKLNVQERMLDELNHSSDTNTMNFFGTDTIIKSINDSKDTEDEESKDENGTKVLLEGAISSGSMEDLKDAYKQLYGDLYTTTHKHKESYKTGILKGKDSVDINYVKVSELSDKELENLIKDEGTEIEECNNSILGPLILENGAKEYINLQSSKHDNVRIKNNKSSQKAIASIKEKGLELTPANVNNGTSLASCGLEVNEENLQTSKDLKSAGYTINRGTIEFAQNLIKNKIDPDSNYADVCTRAYELKQKYTYLTADEAFAFGQAGLDETTSEKSISEARELFANGEDIKKIPATEVLQSIGMEVNEENINKAINLINKFNADKNTLVYLLQPEKYPEEVLKELAKSGDVNEKIVNSYKPKQGEIHPNITNDAVKLVNCYADGVEPIDEFVPKINNSEYNAAIKEGGSLNVGDVFQLEGEDYIRIKTADGKSEKLNISRETYFKLFPPVERYGSVQDSIGNCWEITAINSLLNTPETRVSLLKLFSEEDGNIQISFPNSKYDKIVFKNGEMPEGANEAYYSDGALGVQMLEYADGVEMQQEMIEEATEYLIRKDGSGAELAEFTKYLDEHNGNVYIWFDSSGELHYKNYEEYIKNPFQLYKYDSAATHYRHGGLPSEFYKRVGLEADSCSTSKALNSGIFSYGAPNLKDPSVFDEYVFSIGTKSKENSMSESTLNEDLGLFSTHAYRLEPGKIENGEVKTFKIINPWGIIETEITSDELLKYSQSIFYAKIK